MAETRQIERFVSQVEYHHLM